MQCLAMEVTGQTVAGAFALLGVSAFMFVYLRAQIRKQADASLEAQARGWKNLYEIEHKSNEQLAGTVKILQSSYDRLEQELQRIREDVKNKNKENEELVELNIKHQQTIRVLNHEKSGLEQAIASLKKELDLAQAQGPKLA